MQPPSFTQLLQEDAEYSRSSARARALFGDISTSRLVNPDGFRSNVTWWRRQILQAARMGSLPGPERYSFRGVDLVEACVAAGLGEPRGIGCVLGMMVSQGDVMRKVSWDNEASWAGWALEWVLKPSTSWLLNQAGMGEENGKSLMTQSLLLTHLIKEQADRMVEMHHRRATYPMVDAVYSFSEFIDCARSMGESAQEGGKRELCTADIKYLVESLERRGIVWVERSNGSTMNVIKFPIHPGSSPSAITEADRGCPSVRLTLRRVEDQIKELEDQLVSLDKKIKEALSLGQKPRALMILRRKKQLIPILEHRYGSQGQLETMWLRMREASSDVEILQAYEAGASSLSHMMIHGKLTHEHVTRVTERMQEALADHKEIEEALRSGVTTAMGTQEEAGEMEELERELKQITQAPSVSKKVEKEKEEEGKVDDLVSTLEGLVVTPAPEPFEDPKHQKERDMIKEAASVPLPE